MRKLYFLTFLVISAIISGCGKGGAGELVGAYNKKFKNKQIPLGMVYIPAGRNAIGMTDEDVTFYQGKQSQMISFAAFYMDQTEITNAEYRQFVNWVRDSVAITNFIKDDPTLFITPKGGTAGAPASTIKNINWKKVGNGSALWSSKKGGKYAAKLNGMYHPPVASSRTIGARDLNVDMIRYAYVTKNLEYQAEGRSNSKLTRDDFYDIYDDQYNNATPGTLKPNQHPSVIVYPDTLVWKMDYSYEYNDQMVEAYFNHPSYDKYPVVGITWDQSNAFCAWRTQFYETVARQRKAPMNSRLKYSLPTEAEFEYAARGGRTQTKYPWGGPYIKNAKGCLQANFKVGRGNYADDGALYTVEARAYLPNDYGLYNMAGNVSEWTLDAYNRKAFEDKNPIYRNGKRKTVKGGSWKDMGFFLQNAVSSYEFQNVPRSYIGFRCVSHFPGNDLI